MPHKGLTVSVWSARPRAHAAALRSALGVVHNADLQSWRGAAASALVHLFIAAEQLAFFLFSCAVFTACVLFTSADLIISLKTCFSQPTTRDNISSFSTYKKKKNPTVSWYSSVFSVIALRLGHRGGGPFTRARFNRKRRFNSRKGRMAWHGHTESYKLHIPV